LVIVRSLPRTQETDFENNDPNDADVAEEVADRVVMIAQEIDAKLARKLGLADSDVTGAVLTIPTPVAGEIIQWDSTGLALQGAVPADLDLATVSGTGLLSRSGTTIVGRTLTAPAAGITVTNGTGVSGNPTLVLANDLAAIEGLSSTGLIVRTAPTR
jgi:hypothetical protein